MKPGTRYTMNPLIRLLTYSLLLLAAFSCKNEDPTEAYLRGGTSLIHAGSGNMVIAGYDMNGNGDYDGMVMKVDAEGNILWKGNSGLSLMDGFSDLIMSSDGSYIATGFITSETDFQQKLRVVKIKANGESEWDYIYSLGPVTRGLGITETSDNGFLVCGYIKDNDQTDRDIYLVKISSSGSKLWDKRYGSIPEKNLGSVFDEAYAIISDGSDGFFLTGSWKGSESCCGTSFLMRINASGDSLWTKSLDFTKGQSLVLATDDGVVVSGILESNGGDIVLQKTSMDGVAQWSKTLGGSGFEFSTRLIATSDGGYALTGMYNKSGSSNQDVILYKFNSLGSQTWSLTYGGDNIEQGFGLIQHENGDYSITGMSNTGGSYIFLNRTSSTGEEIWRKSLK
jgi:hypothetical protein